MAGEMCSNLDSGASLCGSDLSFLLFHWVTWAVERAYSQARRQIQLRGVTVSGARVRALMGADIALGHWFSGRGSGVLWRTLENACKYHLS